MINFFLLTKYFKLQCYFLKVSSRVLQKGNGIGFEYHGNISYQVLDMWIMNYEITVIVALGLWHCI